MSHVDPSYDPADQLERNIPVSAGDEFLASFGNIGEPYFCFSLQPDMCALAGHTKSCREFNNPVVEYDKYLTREYMQETESAY